VYKGVLPKYDAFLYLVVADRGRYLQLFQLIKTLFYANETDIRLQIGFLREKGILILSLKSCFPDIRYFDIAYSNFQISKY